jgi:hypothetical protein
MDTIEIVLIVAVIVFAVVMLWQLVISQALLMFLAWKSNQADEVEEIEGELPDLDACRYCHEAYSLYAERDEDGCWIGCDACGATGPTGDTLEEAAALWNEAASEPVSK